jgi:hypothetical protein
LPPNILFEDVLPAEKPDYERVCRDLMYLFDNVELAPVLSDYLREISLSMDSPEVAQLVEKARQPTLRVVGGSDFEKRSEEDGKEG